MRGHRSPQMAGLVAFSLLAPAAWVPLRGQEGEPAPRGAAPLAWGQCLDDQIEVMILGTFHFAPSQQIDVLEPDRQVELEAVLTQLEGFGPDVVAIEYPYAKQAALDGEYRAYLESPDEDALPSKNENHQIGFRLARRLDLSRVAAADVPLNLWDDSIAVFDERYPSSRGDLRRRWRTVARPPARVDGDLGLAENLVRLNRDMPPANEELFGRFLPLVEDELYAGAWKLRPWYDRSLRIVQNLFRHAEPEDDRIVLVIGSAHVRSLKGIMEETPQLCPVDPVPYLERTIP